MAWKTLSSEYLFRDLWFTVRRDHFQTPSGKITGPYYVYEFPDWVSAVALTADNKVILLHQYRHALGEVCIELPGGCVEKSDSGPEAAIARELLEETGYAFSSFEYLGRISANPSTNSNLMHMFLARGGRRIAEPQPDTDEEFEIELVDLVQVKKLIRENKIVQSMHVACLVYALMKMEEVSME
ncbi:MAG TPA: NUDIX hydrolase [Chitinophagaceae bacterium]|nr:NUDIX hydrolase [Chitinophagaceae bacterium]